VKRQIGVADYKHGVLDDPYHLIVIGCFNAVIQLIRSVHAQISMIFILLNHSEELQL